MLLWTSLALTELTLLGGLVWALGLGYRRWGPGRMRGMASREQARSLLGVHRLRKVAPIVRPDLYPRRHHTPRRRDHAGQHPTQQPAQLPVQHTGHMADQRSHR